GRWCGGVCEARGRGPSAGVSRAEQGELAGRPVVLKVSAIEGREPQTLAQLQHTHIVPIYSAHEDTRTGLRALCMPYFGGASLAQVLQRLWATTTEAALPQAHGLQPVGLCQGRPPTRGAQLVEALQAVQAPPPDEARPPAAASHPPPS